MDNYDYSSNLEKLKVANSLAKEILDSKRNTDFHSGDILESKDLAPSILKTTSLEASEVSFEVFDKIEPNATVEMEDTSINYHQDLWGSNNLVEKNERFRFVKDYMLRSDRLLNLSKTIKPSSYQTVTSTNDLYQTSPNLNGSSNTLNDENYDLSNDQTNFGTDKEANTMASKNGEDVKDSKQVLENQYACNIPELLTHRPVFDEDVQLNVFSVHQPTIITPRNVPYHATTKNLEAELNNILDDKVCENQEVNTEQENVDIAGKLEIPCPRNSFLNELLDLTKSYETIDTDTLASYEMDRFECCQNATVAKDNEDTDSKIVENHVDTNSKLLNNKAIAVKSSTSKETVKAMELSNPLDNLTQSFTYSREFTKNITLDTKPVVDKSPKKMRPNSAGMASSNSPKKNSEIPNVHQPCKTNSETIKKRPSSAGKIREKNNVKSPKRTWETSGIAWSMKNRQRNLDNVLKESIKKNSSELNISEKGGDLGDLFPLIEKDKITSKHTNLFSHNYRKMCKTTIDHLPDEMLIHILSFLSFKNLSNIAQVSTRFNVVSKDPCLWKIIKCENIVLYDHWLEGMGSKQPKLFSINNCNGKAVTNRGLRQFFNGCKLSLKELEIARCIGNQFSGDSMLLHASCRCKAIEKLSLPWSGTSDNGLMAICLSLSGIKDLNINGNSLITDESFNVLVDRHANTLNTLEMAGCFSISNQSLMQLTNTCRLEKLNIGVCTKITTDCVISLCSKLFHLKEFDLHSLRAVTDQCIHTIVKNCRNLTTLILASCSSISDVAMSEIATYLPGIQHLDISGCSLISNSGICNLASVSKSLQYFDISSTSATYLSVNSIIQCSHSLKTFKVSFCRQITQRSLENVLNNCPHLKSLHIYGLKNLNFARLVKINRNVVVEK